MPGVGGSLDWSPDGDLFVAEQPDQSGVIDIRDARTGESLRTYRGHEIDLTDVVFNHDGSLLATAGDDGAARIWDPLTGEQLQAMDFRRGDEVNTVLAPSFSPDGRFVAASWYHEGVVRVLDLASGQVVQEIRSIPSPRTTSFDPTGTQLVVVSLAEPRVVVFDVASGRELRTLEGLSGTVIDADWSPDGESIATALPADDSARVFDARTGRQRLNLVGDGSGLTELDWSPDGTNLATGSFGGTVALWQATGASGRRLATLSSQDTRTGVNGLAFSPDGTQLMAGNLDVPATTVWDVSIAGDAEVANLPARPYDAGVVDYAPDGRHLSCPERQRARRRVGCRRPHRRANPRGRRRGLAGPRGCGAGPTPGCAAAGHWPARDRGRREPRRVGRRGRRRRHRPRLGRGNRPGGLHRVARRQRLRRRLEPHGRRPRRRFRYCHGRAE